MSDPKDRKAAPPSPQPPHDDNRGLIAWFINNHVAANILMMLFIIGGLISFSQMRTETFPAIDPRLIYVSVSYPGATPYEVAESITSRVEDALVGINGVKRIASTASEGNGSIRVELEDFADADDVYKDVDTAVSALSSFPPADAERPKITKIKVTPNVMTLALYGSVSEYTLKYWAETIEDEIKQLNGVALTSISGIRNYQISIEIPQSTLDEYGLDLQDIRDVVAAFSIDIPAGNVEAKQGDILLRIQEKRYTGEEFGNIVLKTLPDGSMLRIKDIGKVVDGFEDVNLVSKYNGQRAAFIQISRNESEDTLAIANEVKGYLKTVTLPKGLHLSLQNDETTKLRERISLMLRNAILGFMLVFLLLLLFLDLKLAFWTSAAIPVSFLGGMMIIGTLGYSINMVSLFALIVVLGVVVDDAIVIGESVFEAQEENSDDRNAVVRGVRAVAAPVSIGVATTVAAFAPLLFSTGTLGQIISVIPVVVISILLISLTEAYFILPSHLSNPKRWSRGVMRTIRRGVTKGLDWFVDHVLLPTARFSIRWRYATLAAFVGLGIITAGMFQGGVIRFIFFPSVEGDEVKITVTLPEGTPYGVTESTMNRIEDAINDIRGHLEPDQDHPVFESTLVRIGEVSQSRGGPHSGNGTSKNSNTGQIEIKLVSSDFRNVTSRDVAEMIRKKIGRFPNIEKLEIQSSLIPSDPDIDIELSHPDENILNNAAEDLKKSLNAIKGTIEVADSYDIGKREYVFELTEEGHAVGLTPSALGRQLRAAFFGVEAQRVQRGTSEVIIYVRYPKLQRENPATLSAMRIKLPDGRLVPLTSVAKIKQQQGYSSIESVDGRRIVSVTSSVDTDITTAGAVLKKLREDILPNLKNRYPSLGYSFEGETRSRAEDLQNLGKNMMIALLIIYVLLGAQLRSYIQPLIIMSSIPFGVIGAVWGHYLLGYDLTFISLFGVVALTGVIVNDSVVLMDYYNNQKQQGHSTVHSAMAAIKRRFRPILLTTLTTSLGLLPIIMEPSKQAQFLIPMVISLATGILFGTFVILFLVPNLLMAVEDIGKLFRKIKRKLFTRPAAA